MSGGSLRGVVIDAPLLILPSKYPDAGLDYAIDITLAIDPAVDFVSSISVQVAPSGLGEMRISGLSLVGDVVTVIATGGQPGRHYRLKYIVAMTDGRVFAFVALQPVTPVLPWDQAQPIPSRGFGTAIVWTWTPTLNFSISRNSMLLL